jgi:6-pyruvoyltetrahydropterin/6-carboxytetrahydropterin synthase
MLTATVSHHFSAGHRILGLVGAGAKCSNIHGHTFGVKWTVLLPDLTAGTVEFATLKSIYRGWVDGNLDHGFIAHVNDFDAVGWLAENNSKLFVLDTPPTTEAIAALIAERCQKICPDVKLLSVRVTEGPHNAATWTLDQRQTIVKAREPALPGHDPYKRLAD